MAAIAIRRVALVIFRGRPPRRPRARAAARPAWVRSRMRAASNSARAAKMLKIKRPLAVVVSAQASPSEVNPAPVPVMAASVLRRSRVLRAGRSSCHCSTTMAVDVPRALQ